MQTLRTSRCVCINWQLHRRLLGIINSFVEKDSRFKVIDKPNSGYGDSMNKGLDAARGKYIAIPSQMIFFRPRSA